MKWTREKFQKVYRVLYQRGAYSSGERSPGVRLFNYYRAWLKSPILDVGCGRGCVVKKMQSAGFTAEGLDWAEAFPEARLGDITTVLQLPGFETFTCLDVLEHIPEELLPIAFDNLRQAPRVVLSIHNGHTRDHPNIELHVTRRPFEWWEERLDDYFEAKAITPISPSQKLYLTRTKDV